MKRSTIDRASSSRAQALAEYALIIALIAIIAIVALLFLGGQISQVLHQIGVCLPAGVGC